MDMRKSKLLLSTTLDDVASTGTPVRIDRAPDMFTVAIHVSDFQGSVFIEASLANTPTDADWFEVVPPEVFETETTAIYRNFTGNFLWVRARMEGGDGTGIPIPVGTPSPYGIVDSVLLNY